MAELLPALGRRFSCRQFNREPVADDALDAVLEAGRIAPSAFGMEPWRFVVFRASASKNRLAEACYDQPPAVSAPVLVAIVALHGALEPGSAFVEARLTAEAGGPPPEDMREAWRGLHAQIRPRSWAIGQCYFAAAQMMVQATALGLGSCPMGGFDEAAVATVLGLGSDEAPALVLALGHCAQAQGPRRRRGMGEILASG